MGNLKIILDLLTLLKGIFDKISVYLKNKKRKKEIADVREFEKEVKEND